MRAHASWTVILTVLAASVGLVTCTPQQSVTLPTPNPVPAPAATGTPTTTGTVASARPSATTQPTFAVPSRPPAGQLGQTVRICGTSFCVGDAPWFMYGASEYQSNPQTGIDHPDGTIALARQARLNTVRIINFYDNHGDPKVEPFSEARWRKVDAMVASAHAADMHVLLDLSDYRNVLWNSCTNPYSQDWGDYLKFVAARRNTITGISYSVDPTVVLVSIAGEPLPVGPHTFADRTGAGCTLSYGTADLVSFYTRTLRQWVALSTIPVNTGGLGYLVLDSGIDWQTLFALPDNAVCDIKTYGGMVNFIARASAFCSSHNKPWIDEEFGWQQSLGDDLRARQFTNTNRQIRDHQGSGELFWNLGYQVKPTTYDIGTMTPLAFAAVVAGAAG
jgi:hypothetical protein